MIQSCRKNLTLVKGLNFQHMRLGGLDKQSLELLPDARTIRIPVHMVETINKLIRVQRQLLQDLGRDPAPEEIGEEMDLPPEKVREILKIAQEPVSLETPIGEEDDSHLGDFIEDQGSKPIRPCSLRIVKRTT